jgi:hypothetical protein
MQLQFEVQLPPIQRRTKATTMSRRRADQFPKIVKLLVLAHQIEQAIDEGRAKDYVDVAHQFAVTRARITQLVNLLLLSPEIQTTILTEPHRVQHLSERQLRPITEEPNWQKQAEMFKKLLAKSRAESVLD